MNKKKSKKKDGFKVILSVLKILPAEWWVVIIEIVKLFKF
jgi:hypothetical protein